MNESIVFNAAVKLPQDQRPAFLDAACAGNPQLRSEVEGLLQEHDGAGNFMQRPAAQPPATDLFRPITEGPGTLVGPYKLLQQIGEGGFGVVYMAEQQEPVRRKVALKIIKPGMDTKEVIARFESERQALALMDHPNIARVLDAGATESGRPYFVMELVKGVPITEYCDKNNLPTEKRLELFITVCHAVQHAHQKGVIHRDLKPSNVMVTLHDGQPVPKVIDFGVAKATSQRLTERTLFTAYGQMVGTPAYMSPEQAEMSGLDIDTRSDTYSLGVLLYELLTGTTPFDGRRLRDAGYIEMQRIIREEEPPRPSTRVSTLGEKLTVVSNHRSTDPAKLRLLLRGDLDLIVMKAMEKERSRRYDTPNSFADDVLRFLNHEAILARPASAAYRLRKFIQRNKAAVVTATAIAATLLIGTAVSTGLAIHAVGQSNLANRQREIAESAKQDAELQRDTAVKAKQAEGEQRQLALQQKQAAESARNAERELREAADQKRQDIERQSQQITGLNNQLQVAAEQQRRTLYTAQMNLVHSAWTSDNIPWMLDHLNALRPQPGQEDLRGFEWHYWHRMAHSDLRTTQVLDFLQNSSTPVFNADGSRLATVVFAGSAASSDRDRSSTRTIKVWDTTTGQAIWSLPLPIRAAQSPSPSSSTETARLYISPDGNRVALVLTPLLSAARGGDVEVQLFDVGSQTPRLTLREQGFQSYPPGGVAFSRDSARLAVRVTQTGQGNETTQDVVKIWDANGGQIVATVLLGPYNTSGRRNTLAMNSNGSCVAAFYEGVVKVWDANSQAEITRITVPVVLQMKFSPDGQKLAARIQPFDTSASNSQSVPRSLLTTSDIKIWDTSSGAELANFSANGQIQTIDFSPDGKWVTFLPVATYALRSVQLLDAATGLPGPLFKGHAAGVIAVAYSEDSSRLFSVATDGVLKEWDISASVRALTAGRIARSRYPMVSGSRMILGSLKEVVADATIIASASRLPSVSGSPLVSPDEARAESQRLTLYRGEDNSVLHTIEMSGPIDRLVASANGRRLAAATFFPTEPSQPSQIGVWDVATGRELLSLQVPLPQPVREAPAIALSPDGKHLALALPGGSGANLHSALRIVEVDTQRVLATGDQTSGFIERWIYSPDGSRLLAISPDRRLVVCDARTARTLWTTPYDKNFNVAAFSADGAQVFAYFFSGGGQSGLTASVQILDAATGKKRFEASAPYAPSRDHPMALSPDGKLLAGSFTALAFVGRSPDVLPEGVQVWDVATQSLAYTLKGHSASVASIAFTPDSRRIATSTGTAVPGQLRAGNGETKLWEARTGQELAVLGEGTSNLQFVAGGRQLIGYNRDFGPNDFQLHCWNAAPLAPEREAAFLVEDLFSKPINKRLPLKSEALAQIEADASLSDSVRAAAGARILAIRRSAAELNDTAWQVVRLKNQPRDKYERALAYLLEACETDPEDLRIWHTRGVAHYRLGQYNEALAAFNRSKELNSAAGDVPGDDLLFLAMTYHHLGDEQKANDFLLKSREVINKSANIKVLEWRRYLADAEVLLGVQSVTPLATAAKSIAKWGEPVDPLGDCQIDATDDVLSITVPGTLHNLTPNALGTDAPRVLQEVEGDFTVQVKVTCPIKPEAVLAGVVTIYHGAGLLVYLDDRHFLRAERNGFFRRWDLDSGSGRTGNSPLSSNAPTIQYFHNGGDAAHRTNWSGSLPQLPGDSTWLRIERRGNSMQTSLSHDGQTWEDPHIIQTSFPPRVRVGVHVINSSGDQFKAEFSDLKLTQP